MDDNYRQIRTGIAVPFRCGDRVTAIGSFFAGRTGTVVRTMESVSTKPTEPMTAVLFDNMKGDHHMGVWMADRELIPATEEADG
jgi:hypothetical protein